MILQALADYYRCKASDADSPLAPPGFEYKAIPFIIVIDGDGCFVDLEDTRTPSGKKLLARSFLVPAAVKKTSAVAANLLWDTAEYVLGVDTRGHPERVAEQHRVFVDRIAELDGADPGADAVLVYLSGSPQGLLSGLAVWPEIVSGNPLVTFRLQGASDLICQRSAVQRWVMDNSEGTDRRQMCLISGEIGSIERLHPVIKGVKGAQSSGANIVSFNLDAFCSFHSEQGANAPVGKEATFAYTTALNYLLRRDSEQRFLLGDTTTVVWAQKPVELEQALPLFFADAPKDDPDAHTRAITSLFGSIRNGAYIADDGATGFHVLGLAPNNARIAVRFWQIGTVADFSERIARYFTDLEIIGHEKYGYPSLFRLLLATAALHKADNINPLLAGSVLRCVLDDLPLPAALLQSVIRRLHAERQVSYERAAIIKACLNRKFRKLQLKHKEVAVTLDIENTDTGYRLGRLFALLERIQEAANPRRNATIRDRFYSAASSTPVTVFANLLRLANHHLAKLEVGHRAYYEKRLGEVMSGVADFPAHLRIEQQGQFAIGYYHQRQALFQKRPETANEPTEA